MIDANIVIALATGIMFGVIHAFDVDHIMAMATFSNPKQKKKHVLKYAIKWGMGHGGVLLLLGLLLAFIGLQLPQWFVHYSEVLVGVVLIYLGAKLVLLMQRKGFLGSGLVDNILDKSIKKHDHTPLFIGMLHGVAGSGPLLALLPNMLETQFILHISLFSFGCLIGMFCFGYVFGTYQMHLQKIKENVAKVITQLLGFSSVGLGAFWIFN